MRLGSLGKGFTRLTGKVDASPKQNNYDNFRVRQCTLRYAVILVINAFRAYITVQNQSCLFDSSQLYRSLISVRKDTISQWFAGGV